MDLPIGQRRLFKGNPDTGYTSCPFIFLPALQLHHPNPNQMNFISRALTRAGPQVICHRTLCNNFRVLFESHILLSKCPLMSSSMVTSFSQVPGWPLKINRERQIPKIKDGKPVTPEAPLCEKAASLSLSPFCNLFLIPPLGLPNYYHNIFMAQMEELGLTGI